MAEPPGMSKSQVQKSGQHPRRQYKKGHAETSRDTEQSSTNTDGRRHQHSGISHGRSRSSAPNSAEVDEPALVLSSSRIGQEIQSMSQHGILQLDTLPAQNPVLATSQKLQPQSAGKPRVKSQPVPPAGLAQHDQGHAGSVPDRSGSPSFLSQGNIQATHSGADSDVIREADLTGRDRSRSKNSKPRKPRSQKHGTEADQVLVPIPPGIAKTAAETPLINNAGGLEPRSAQRPASRGRGRGRGRSQSAGRGAALSRLGDFQGLPQSLQAAQSQMHTDTPPGFEFATAGRGRGGGLAAVSSQASNDRQQSRESMHSPSPGLVNGLQGLQSQQQQADAAGLSSGVYNSILNGRPMSSQTSRTVSSQPSRSSSNLSQQLSGLDPHKSGYSSSSLLQGNSGSLFSQNQGATKTSQRSQSHGSQNQSRSSAGPSQTLHAESFTPSGFTFDFRQGMPLDSTGSSTFQHPGHPGRVAKAAVQQSNQVKKAQTPKGRQFSVKGNFEQSAADEVNADVRNNVVSFRQKPPALNTGQASLSRPAQGLDMAPSLAEEAPLAPPPGFAPKPAQPVEHLQHDRPNIVEPATQASHNSQHVPAASQSSVTETNSAPLYKVGSRPEGRRRGTAKKSKYSRIVHLSESEDEIGDMAISAGDLGQIPHANPSSNASAEMTGVEVGSSQIEGPSSSAEGASSEMQSKIKSRKKKGHDRMENTDAKDGSAPGSASKMASDSARKGSRRTSGKGGRGTGRTRQTPGRDTRGPGRDDAEQPFTDFEPYLSPAELAQTLEQGQAFRCELRINANDRSTAFACFEGLPNDIQLQDCHAQNRAFPGDEVAVVLNEESKWISQKFSLMKSAKEALAGQDAERVEGLTAAFSAMSTEPVIETGTAIDSSLSQATTLAEAKQVVVNRLKSRPDLRPTGRVVAITRASERRQRIVGVLQRTPGGQCYLNPTDARMPRFQVESHRLPDNLRKLYEEDMNSLSNQLVSGMLLQWEETSELPTALIRSSLGEAGELEAETKAILETEGIDTSEFSPEVLECLPPTPWQISPEEIAKRRDLRLTRLFTIDPPTARDLDDALSIEDKGDGRWQVGVHIADVSFFIPPGSALDKIAADRATSTYMIQEVIHMLPRLLCEELCSLNAGVDRLAFSVIWDLDEKGNVLSQWTGRTVIRSCGKLAYHHAQKMVDGVFDKSSEDLPKLELPHTWDEVIGDVLALNKIARNLHSRRFQQGALRLDKTKLTFSINADGNPSNYKIYAQEHANELVAEFMLLANMSVAQMIGRAFPENAMLRRHPAPQDRQLGELEAIADRLGYDVDCSSAASIQESLKQLRANGENPLIIDILQLQIMRPMKPAKYFSTGSYTSVEDWRHYALAAPMYTHFTSPIRRYPDVVVHRLLAKLLSIDSEACKRKFSPNPTGSSYLNPPLSFSDADTQPEEELTTDEEEVVGDDSESEISLPVMRRTAASSESDEDLPAAPRPIAEKVRRPRRENATALKASGKLSVSNLGLPVSEDVLDNERLATLATHCNERKYSAKVCSEQSSHLYLCVLMRAQPTIFEAVVTILNGRKFFDVYIPALGVEERLSTVDMSPPVFGDFNPDKKCLTLTDMRAAKKSQLDMEGTSACLKDIRNLDQLSNPQGLKPLTLPINLKAFSKIPVVVSAGSDAPGRPLHLITVMYLSTEKLEPSSMAGARNPVVTRRERRQKQQTQGQSPTPDGQSLTERASPQTAPSAHVASTRGDGTAGLAKEFDKLDIKAPSGTKEAASPELTVSAVGPTLALSSPGYTSQHAATDMGVEDSLPSQAVQGRTDKADTAQGVEGEDPCNHGGSAEPEVVTETDLRATAADESASKGGEQLENCSQQLSAGLGSPAGLKDLRGSPPIEPAKVQMEIGAGASVVPNKTLELSANDRLPETAGMDL